MQLVRNGRKILHIFLTHELFLVPGGGLDVHIAQMPGVERLKELCEKYEKTSSKATAAAEEVPADQADYEEESQEQREAEIEQASEEAEESADEELSTSKLRKLGKIRYPRTLRRNILCLTVFSLVLFRFQAHNIDTLIGNMIEMKQTFRNL